MYQITRTWSKYEVYIQSSKKMSFHCVIKLARRRRFKYVLIVNVVQSDCTYNLKIQKTNCRCQWQLQTISVFINCRFVKTEFPYSICSVLNHTQHKPNLQQITVKALRRLWTISIYKTSIIELYCKHYEKDQKLFMMRFHILSQG